MKRAEWLPKLIDDLAIVKHLLADIHKNVDDVLGAEDVFDEKDYVINNLLDLTQALDAFRPVVTNSKDYLEDIPVD